MLCELRIESLGVIEQLSLVLPEGSIAITGETGAGKTMIVGAIQLLMGGRADPDMVRVGASEAVVEGRFLDDDGDEIVARRVIPADGRSRAYLDGSLATAGALAERIGPLVDLHGQHAQQTLTRPDTQRDALDLYAGLDLSNLVEARKLVADLKAQLNELGGDGTERARQIDLLGYQLEELTTADLDDPNETHALDEREQQLAHAFDDQLAAAKGAELLGGDGAISDGLAQIASTLQTPIFEESLRRVTALQEELTDLASTLRSQSETIADDPEQREATRARRQLLAELQRKYGPNLSEVIAYRDELAAKLALLESHEERVADLTERQQEARVHLAEVSSQVLADRLAAADPLARAIEARLSVLAMPSAQLEVRIDGEAGDHVEILLAANPGLPALPIGKNASGGELSRTMLALRLVIAGGPSMNVFDEVDAGIGGETARAVGEALASLGNSRQVFVVTHLAQVASRTTHHIVIDKSVLGNTTTSQARLLSETDRVIEISRMLSGSPDSSSAREHAEELLDLTELENASTRVTSARYGDLP